MGYQNVATPRFYIDQFSYLLASGKVDRSYYDGHTLLDQNNVFNYPGLVGLNPASEGAVLSSPNYRSFDIPTGLNTSTPVGIKTGYVAILGHTLYSSEVRASAEWHDGNGDKKGITKVDIVNLDGGTGSNYPGLDGFTIYKFTTEPDSASQSRFFRSYYHHDGEWTANINALSWGFIYDMPHSPDLSLTMSHEYDGIKQVTTKGGSTLSNANYYKSPKWGDKEAWQLGDWSFGLYASSRRTWDLSFSYVSDSDLEPYNYFGGKWSSDTGTPTHEEPKDNFFQNVLYYTMGGHLPFIFCPDPSIEYYYDTNNPSHTPRVPEFAICRFDMKSFKRTQVSFKTYNIKIKIVESW
jgi:hypothetical protein